MAKKGERKHMKRLSSPKKIFIKDRKKRGRRFLIKTAAGTHKREYSEPLAFLLREQMGIAKSLREVKFILNQSKVKVDGRVRKNPEFPVGLMDIITIGNENYVIGIDEKGRLKVEKTETGNLKLKKVMNKVTVSKDKYQLTFHDGNTYLTNDNNIKIGDSVLFNITEKKIEKHIPLKEGALCLVIEGKHSGGKAKLKEVVMRAGIREAVLDFNNKEVITRWNYLFALNEG